MISRFINRLKKKIKYGFLLLFVLTILLLVSLFACSPVPRHKTLAFFFDGVPSPNEAPAVRRNDSIVKRDTTADQGLVAKEEKSTVHYHVPYKEKKCGSCHDQNTMGKFVKPQPALCYQCHDDFSKKYKVVHGPVGGGYCTACHEKHMANNQKLLKKEGQDLCFYCHSPAEVLKIEAHKSISDKNCTECHNPHGGKDRNMLK
ncbi:MAG: cytochrome c3 family protein [Bacteroidota bacterium]